MPTDTPFAAALRRLREARGMSPPELAEAAGLHRQAVWYLETGRRRPRWATVLKLAEALGVDERAFRP